MRHGLAALAAFGVGSISLAALPPPVRAELKPCVCTDLDTLQQELENAITLRDRHKAKADELERRLKENVSETRLKEEYSAWEADVEKGAGAGIVSTAPKGSGKAVKAISYTPRGSTMLGELPQWWKAVTENGYSRDRLDPEAARKIEADYRKRGIDLCDFAEAVRPSAEASSACKGIEDALVEHEEVHRKTCSDMGFFAFLYRTPDQLARDEVRAYDRQIASLRKLISNALKGAEVAYEDSSNVTYSGQMLTMQFTTSVKNARGKIPDHEDGTWNVTLTGVHTMAPGKMTIPMGGSCKMGPITRSVDMDVSAKGKTSTIRFTSFGKTSTISNRCEIGGRGAGGSAVGGPSAGSGDVELPLRLSASRTQDLSKNELAATMKGVMTVSGTHTANLNIICPPQK